MEITNSQVLRSIAPLKYLSDQEMPIKISYRLSRIIRQVDNILKDVEAARKQLLEKYSEKDETGNPIIQDKDYVLKKDEIDQFDAEYQELMKESNELEFVKLSLSDLDSVSIKTSCLLSLEWLIED